MIHALYEAHVLAGSRDVSTAVRHTSVLRDFDLFFEIESHFVDQAGLELRDASSPSGVLGLKVCTTTLG